MLAANLYRASRNIGVRQMHTAAAARQGWSVGGMPLMFNVTTDRPFHPDRDYYDYETMPRDDFGVPAHIPPDLSTVINHTYCVPPQYYPFLKKLGDDTPEIKPFMDKLINGFVFLIL